MNWFAMPDQQLVILQTRVARHLEDRVHGEAARLRVRWGEITPLCGTYVGDAKRIRVRRIPTAAVCPRCVEVARGWYGPYAFEPFDCVQRLRLLKNIDRDLEMV